MYNRHLPSLLYKDSLNQVLTDNHYLAIKVKALTDIYEAFYNNDFIQTLLHGDSFQALLKNTYAKIKKIDSEYNPILDSLGFYVSIPNNSFHVLSLDNTIQYTGEEIYSVIEDRVI